MKNDIGYYVRSEILVERAKTGDKQAVVDLCVHHIRILRAGIQRAVAKIPELKAWTDDLESCSYEIMQYLVSRFDPAQSKFCAYLKHRVHYHFMKQGWVLLGWTTAGLGLRCVSLDALLAAQSDEGESLPAERGALDEGYAFVDDRAEAADPNGPAAARRRMLEKSFECLTAKQRVAFEAYYLSGEQTYASAGALVGLSAKQIDNRITLGMKRLRAHFEGQNIKGFGP